MGPSGAMHGPGEFSLSRLVHNPFLDRSRFFSDPKRPGQTWSDLKDFDGDSFRYLANNAKRGSFYFLDFDNKRMLFNRLFELKGRANCECLIFEIS